jgi:alpha-tubulin suppressor-like RCC1 family protein
MIKNILLQASRSYNPYVQSNEIWGAGQTFAGELDNDFNGRKFIPFDNSTNWKSVAINNNHAIAIKTDGTLWQWGTNTSGQLGLNDVVTRSSPVQVGTLNSWVSASVQNNATIALKSDGTLWSWGDNTNGQLGLNDLIPRSSPVQIGTRTWKDLSGVGANHTIAIGNDDTIWGWGYTMSTTNNVGVYGNGEYRGGFGVVDFVEGPWSVAKAGGSFTVAIKSDGKLYAWGTRVAGGQLGLGDTIVRSSPVQIGNDTWVSASLSPGASATDGTVSAIKIDGTLWTWGNNGSGQLGQNDTVSRSSPVQVGTLTNWMDTFVANQTILAVKTDGTLWAWGSNGSFQLGNNALEIRQIDNLTTWVSASAGYQNVVALKTDGTMWTWGTNNLGQLGLGDTINRSSPVQVGTLTWTKAIVGGLHVAAIRSDGTLWTWGSNNPGQLGINLGVTAQRSSPVQVGTLTWKDVTAGPSHTMAVRNDNTIWAWGSNNLGELADGTNITRSSPVQIGTLNNWANVVIPTRHDTTLNAITLKTDGTIWTWGANTLGQLGLNDNITRSSPVQIGTRSDWVSVSISNGNGGAIRSDGTLWMWGYNALGQRGVGDGTLINRSSPVQIGTRTDWSKLFLGRTNPNMNTSAQFALRNDGTLWGWGSVAYMNNLYGAFSSPVQLGTGANWTFIDPDGSGFTALAINTSNQMYGYGTINAVFWSNAGSRSSPIQIGTDTNWAKVGGSNQKVFAIKNDGTLWGWGGASTGFPLINTSEFTVAGSPLQVGSDLWYDFDIGKLSAPSVYGIKQDGTLWAWGIQNNGELGLNDTITRSSPVQIGTRIWSKLSAGTSHVMAIRNDNTLWSWGGNAGAQLSLGDTVSRSSPVQVGVENDWISVNAGITHNVAIRTRFNNDLYTGGQSTATPTNADHNVIKGWGSIRRSPILLSQTNPWSKLNIGSNQTFGIKSNGTLWAWGSNSSGQLGLGDTVDRYSPVQVGISIDWQNVVNQSSFTFGIKTNGTLWSWGSNSSGQLGNGTIVSRSLPVQVGTLLWNYASGTSTTTSFGIRSNGTLWAWGSNSNGELGLNDTITRSSPVQIGTETNWSRLATPQAINTAQFAIKTDNSMYVLNGALTPNTVAGISFYKSSPVQVTSTRNWKSVNAGTSFTIAISTSGSMWAWGTQANGVIGNNTVTASASQESPVQIGTLTTWASASAGEGNVVAIRNDNTIWTWGANTAGQLAQNNTISRSSPVQVGTLTNWLRVSAGRSHVMAIKTDGTLWGWGINTNNNIGDGTITSRSSAVQIGTRTDWSKISAGDGHTMAITTGGELYAMGMGTVGQQGTNNVSPGTQPQRVGTSTWTDVAAGHQMTAAVRSDGTLWTWGQGTDGRLGLLRNRSLPNYVDASTTFTSISTGDETALAIAYDGKLWSWGGNGNGALGFNDTTSRSSPVQVGTRTWNKISVGDFSFVLAVRSDNTLWSWGGNAFGNLGFNDTTNRSSPVQVGTLSNWKEVSSGYLHSHAVKTDGTLWGWGYNAPGVLGLGDTADRSSPVQVGTLTNWSKVGSIFGTAFGLKTDGTLWSWGRGVEGQRGSNNALSISSPVQIGTRTWSFIADGGGGLPSMQTYHMLAVRSDGTLWTWGKNDIGQLGLNDTVTRSSPVQIGTETNWASGEVGGSSTMAIKTNGTLWAWGLNTSAMLGLGNTINRSSPVQVGTLSSWVSASIGEQHTVLLQNNGYVLTTGASNQSGEPGFETNRAINRSNPVQIGIDTNWQKVNIGNTPILGSAPPQILAQKTDGTLWTWGGNTVGNLGDGTLTTKSSPVQLGNETTWVNFDAEQHFVGIKQY